MAAGVLRGERSEAGTVRIRPRTGWAGIDARQLWAHRELLYFLIWRDLKVRYRQTAFGVAWAVLQPVLLALVFTVFFGRLSGIAPSGTPYALFVLSGLVPWTFFAQGTTGIANSLVNAASLLQKVYFPRLLLPLASVGGYLLDFLLATVVLVGVMFATGRPPGVAFLAVVPFAVLATLVSLALGIWLSAINVRYRDVRYALPFLIQVLLFLTPVVYAVSLVPEGWRWLYELNPMVGVVEGMRWAVLADGDLPGGAIATSIVVSLLLLATGLAYFRRVERTFADVI